MRKLAFCALLGLGIGGCQPLVQVEASSEDLSQLFDPPTADAVIANFDPLSGVLPFPTNILFAAGGNEPDGTIDVPVPDPNDYGDPAVAMNSLDGFSGIASAYTSFSGTLDESTVVAGDTVRVFQVNLEGFFQSASSVVRELTAPDALLGVVGEYTVQVLPQPVLDENKQPTGLTYDTIAVVPTFPLPAESSYVIVVTTDILDVRGNQIQRDLIYSISQLKRPLLNEAGQSQFALPADSFSDDAAAALEPLRVLNSSYEDVIESYGIPSSSVAVSWSYTISSTTTMLDVIASEMEPTRIEAGPLLIPYALAPLIPGVGTAYEEWPRFNLAGNDVVWADTLAAASAGGDGTADLLLGTLEVPFYLDPEDPVGGFWMGLQGQFPTRFYHAGSGPGPRGPEMRSSEVVPMIITVPNENGGCEKPADGWPATMFVHTNTQNRTNVIALANALSTQSAEGANDCAVGIGIDMPVSGIDDPEGAGLLFGTNTIAQLPWFPTTGNLVTERYQTNPDVELDPIGTTTFFNPQSLLTIRDNIRQAVVDHLAAAKAVPEMRDTWTGTFKAAAIQGAAYAIVPGGQVDPVTKQPVTGPIRDLIDAQEAIVKLDDNGAPESGAGAATVGALLATGAAAQQVVSGLVLTDSNNDGTLDSPLLADADEDGTPETPIPNGGALYDAQRVAVALSIAQAAGGDFSGDAATLITALSVTMDGVVAQRGVEQGFVIAGAVVGIPGITEIEPYKWPDVSDETFRAELDAALEPLATNAEAGSALSAVGVISGLLTTKVADAVSKAQQTDALLATAVATFEGWETAVNTFVTRAQAVADVSEAAKNSVQDAYDTASREEALSDGMVAQLATLSGTVTAIDTEAQKRVDGHEGDPDNPEDLSFPPLADAAKAATDKLDAAALVAANSTALIALIGSSGGDGQYGAFEDALANAGDVEGTLTALLGSVGAVAGTVQATADLVATQDANGAPRLDDPETAVGLTFATILQGLGDGESIAGAGALAGAVASAIAEQTQLLLVVPSAWKSKKPFIDASKLSITGHAMGAVVALLTASLTKDYQSVIASSPTGGLAYAFEKSATFGPALVDGLGAAVGAKPGDPTWEQYFNVFQNVMDQADPLYFVDQMPDSTGVLVIEFEDDSFFPNSDASRPLTGSSPLIEMMGLERTTRSIDGNGGPVRAAVTVNTSNSAADFATFLTPFEGCPDNALGCINANLEVRSELHEQTRSMIVNGGKAVEVNALSPTGAVILE